MSDMSLIDIRIKEEKQRVTHPYAALSTDTRGRQIYEPLDTIRTVYERDGHRILHSKPFRRLRNKTQVFFSPENDHITTRMDHSLYVATISRTVCRSLGLNDDLSFAIALGHDLGHSPFGHSGEKILEELLNSDQKGGPFEEYSHESQSLHVVDHMSTMSGHDYVGLNLTYEVRDGIRCHCGESVEQKIPPRSAKDDGDPSDFKARDTLPITMEGCVVRMADRVAYLGRDYEDAQTALQGLPPLPDIVLERLGEDNRQIINVLVLDMIRENQKFPETIGFSKSVFEAMMVLREFNYTHIYEHKQLESYRKKVARILGLIFDVLVHHLENRASEQWGVSEPHWPFHLNNLAHFIKGARFSVHIDPVHVVVNYLSLMTDGFAFKIFKSIAIPKSVV